MGRHPRQRPISCHLCRVRKLRCSRQFPCSNCTSRGLVCQHEDPAVAPPSADPSASLSTINAALSKDVSVHDLLSRLERLENLVASQSKESSVDRHSASQPEQPGLPPDPVPPRLERLVTDALRIDKSYLDLRSSDSIWADPIVFRVCPLSMLFSQPAFLTQCRDSFPNQEVEAVRCIWLPLRHEMRVFMDKYFSSISHFHHVIHVPTVQSLFDDVYLKLESDSPVEIGAMLLLVSICANVANGWPVRDEDGFLLPSAVKANNQSVFWMKQGLDVSEHAQRIAHSSLECLQGVMLLFMAFCNKDNVSQRTRRLLMLTTAMATELQLHRIDGPSPSLLPSPTGPTAKMSEIRKEVGRRIWSHLVTMDWILVQCNQAPEGFLALSTMQTTVNKPRNLRDEDLVDGGQEIAERPMSEPTSVSYLIQRIRLVEFAQWMAERSSQPNRASELFAFKNVLEIDSKLKDFIGQMPDFFALDNSSLNGLPPTDPRRSPLLAAQRYGLNLVLLQLMCKLHLPYLVRGSADPALAYSRDVCLRSASVVLELDQNFLDEEFHYSVSKIRLSLVFRNVFLASIVLALNACVKGDAADGVDGVEQAATAWHMIQEGHGQSPSGIRLLELSIQLLRKYKIKHDAVEALQQHVGRTAAMAGGDATEPARLEQSLGLVTQPFGSACEPEPAATEKHWQYFEGKPGMEINLGVMDWDRLFGGVAEAPLLGG